MLLEFFSSPRSDGMRIIMARFLLAAVLSTAAIHAGIILDLDAKSLPAGTIAEWKDSTPSGGIVRSDSPLRIEQVQGRTAVIFDGVQQMVAEFRLAAGLEKKPFTVEAWALNPNVEKMEVLVALAPVLGGPGTEFSYSSSPGSGAFRSGFKATTPFGNIPTANVWHHLVWTYAGGADGLLKVYVDGELDTERELKFILPPQAKIHIGASAESDKSGPKKGFSGALARVRIYDQVLSQSELRQGAGLLHAFAPEPRHGSTTDSLNVSLSWQHGTANAASSLVYISTDRSAVERSYKNLAMPVAGTTLGPVPLKVGTKYFWRVDDLDNKGQVIAPGMVWTFTADAGLASLPQPRHQDSNVSPALAQLSWIPGKYVTHLRLFFGVSAEEVEKATIPAAEFPAETKTCALPVKLAPGTRSYWRVDSDNGQQPASHGQVWTFRTQDAPVKDDVTFFVSSDSHYGRENNAAINRRVIDEMNALPGTPLPSSVGGGFVRTPRGVILNGDLLDEGFNKDTAPALWAEFCRDYGLTGTDGRLCFPMYEGFGNHDGGPTKSFVRAGIKERNPKRIGLKEISPDGHHYSWDWDHLHLVQLNLFGGASPADVKGVNAAEHDPEMALQFLHDDLARHVGSTGRRVITFQHFGWLGGMADWWQGEAKERFYDEVKPYQVACLINGHSHGAAFVPWHDLLTIHDGSTARGEGDNGDFMVVRVTAKELIVIQRKLGEWGIYKRMNLGEKSATVTP